MKTLRQHKVEAICLLPKKSVAKHYNMAQGITHFNRRGIKEAIWERVESPSLNKKGGLRYNLSHAWDSAIKQIPRRLLSHDQNSGSVAL